ncbi:hypothetical protein [Campylobacter concisus]|nr:hypothetical protein [Campylobacter concisus]
MNLFYLFNDYEALDLMATSLYRILKSIFWLQIFALVFALAQLY